MNGHERLAMLKWGDTLSNQGKFPETIALCDLVLSEEPENAIALNLKGFCLGSLGRNADARACFKLATLYLPVDALIRYNLGKALDEAGDSEAALAEYSESLRLSPGQFVARVSRGALLVDLGDSSGAMNDFDELVGRYPDNARALMLRGGCLLVMKRFVEGHTDLKKALKLELGLQAEVDRLISGCLSGNGDDSMVNLGLRGSGR